MLERDEGMLLFGTTPLENAFVSDYLPYAEGDYVKFYVMGLYHALRGDADASVQSIAGELNMDVSRAEAAVRYWERRGLMSSSGGDNPALRFYSAAQRKLTGQVNVFEADEGFIAFSEGVYALFGDERKVTTAEIALAYEWVQDLKLSPEAVMVLLGHMKLTSGKHFSFQRAQKLAARMHDEQVVSGEDAEHYLSLNQQMRSGAAAVLRRIGIRTIPTDDETALYTKWVQVWHFEEAAIQNACALMTSATVPSFKYLDGILLRLREQTPERTAKGIARSEEKTRAAKAYADALGLVAPDLQAVANSLKEMEANGVSPQVALLSARECKKHGQKYIDKASELALSWQEKGLDTPEKVEEYLKQIDRRDALLHKIFDACGHRGRITKADRDWLNAWQNAGHGEDVILYAASLAAGAEGGKMRYIDRVLQSYQVENIHSVQEAQSRTPSRRESGKTVSAQQYTQRDYSQADDDRVLSQANLLSELLKEESK